MARTRSPLQPSQDHKAVRDNDEGPNTGGMGAYCDGRILTRDQSDDIMRVVIEPAIARMAAENTPFTGFLYAGLMMTDKGPKVLEFNARLGDPETQAIMHRMDSDFAPVLQAAANGDLAGASIEWKQAPSVCVVLAAHGYPGEVRSGDLITGIVEAEHEGAIVFQAGTRQATEGVVTSGRPCAWCHQFRAGPADRNREHVPSGATHSFQRHAFPKRHRSEGAKEILM